MLRKALFLLLLPSLVLASSDFDCEDELEKIDKCEASTNFRDMYKQICHEGNEMEPAHLIAYEKALEMELTENSCLEKIYVHPKYQPGFEG